MRKVHCKVTLDVFALADEDVDIVDKLRDTVFMINPENNDALEDVADVYSVDVTNVEVSDSR